ncbi:hypothetical protein [Rhizobium mayense]|uniref:EAL domain-containing protein n=1 Tax=Rhizobium mayense TaxID=1312184 RepID=A0ABT7K5W3_9HYPH|nr:hypothetical protein [Rhizobium mayense]MDL2402529.1 hypothetical protein [Rhizobium mayense]
MAERKSEYGVPERVAIETALKPALRKLMKLAVDQWHLWPAFQSIVDIRVGCIDSSKIITRWDDPRVGEITP